VTYDPRFGDLVRRLDDDYSVAVVRQHPTGLGWIEVRNGNGTISRVDLAMVVPVLLHPGDPRSAVVNFAEDMAAACLPFPPGVRFPRSHGPSHNPTI
jgi:hypothetical protein